MGPVSPRYSPLARPIEGLRPPGGAVAKCVVMGVTWGVGVIGFMVMGGGYGYGSYVGCGGYRVYGGSLDYCQIMRLGNSQDEGDSGDVH